MNYPPELSDAARFIVDKIDKGADLQGSHPDTICGVALVILNSRLMSPHIKNEEFKKHIKYDTDIARMVGKSLAAIQTNLNKIDHDILPYLPTWLMTEAERKLQENQSKL